MTTLELSNAIQGRFASEVATPQALLTIYDNDPTPAPTQALVWCRFTVKDGESRRITIGGVKQYRTVGVAIAQIFGRLGEGTAGVRSVADAITIAFRDVTADGVKYSVPYADNIGDNNEGNYQLNMVCPYQADTIDS
jgi:hypothetical protein